MPYINSSGLWVVQHSYIADWRFYDLQQNVGSPVAVPDGQWVKVKLYTRMNTPGADNGVVMLWIDDELKLSHDNVNIRENSDCGFGKLIMGSYATPSSGSDGFEWFDGWVLSLSDPEWVADEQPTELPGTPGGVIRTDTKPPQGD